MKKLALLAAASVLLVACDEKKPVAKTAPEKAVSAADLKPPQNLPPPVETQPYEDGFAAGTTAGELAGKAKPTRPARKPLAEADLEVLALEAAGSHPDRGAKWQRGFVSGYRGGFDRTARGIR